MFGKVLVANRGEIACRILRTLRRLGVATVAVYSDADRFAPHVTLADEAVRLGPGAAAESYLRQSAVLRAAEGTGAQAIHPGYGFLSENADFADACIAAGRVFIGPTADQIRDFGLKHRARELAADNGVALLPGSTLLNDIEEARSEASRIGYPVMLKSTAGGGGIGMQRVSGEPQLAQAFAAVERLAAKNFSRGGVFLEKFIERARHIEVQIFGDGAGRVIALGERDCSTQRRNQKIIEETPAAGLSDAIRASLHAAAVRLASAVRYQSAGTVEFVFDVSSGQFYFLEVNTRLQVEHGITEEVTGIDLVEWMVRQAAGERLDLQATPRGAAIEVRLYAEDPAQHFRPSAGLITHVQFPVDTRIETWIQAGTEITPLYDPLLAKIITAGTDRADALMKLQRALRATRVAGIETNLDYLRCLIDDPVFVTGAMTTRALESFVYTPNSVDVLSAGTQTTIQDFPGRIGYWNVGVPPSGPMDALSFRLANRTVGNPAGASGLEMTVAGPSLKFNAAAVICIAGADVPAHIGARRVPLWQPVQVAAGDILKVGAIAGAGVRAYLAVRGGFDVPEYLGSRSTFTLGKFGGHAGRALLPGDTLHLGGNTPAHDPCAIPSGCIPLIGNEWQLSVLYGPHAAPDFFTEQDITEFFAAAFQVHYNSSRTGVRLIGPKPEWARSDGGEAGLHPSNIHDNAYAIGAVDFTGDMPVILGPDGPSLGGFVCPVTVITADLWKLGQLRPNDQVRFQRVSPDAALQAELEQLRMIESLLPTGTTEGVSATHSAVRRTACENGADAAVLLTVAAQEEAPAVVYRRAGDKYLLIEYGPAVLDLELRLRVHALMTWLESAALPGVIELTPGIRSLQVHYESRVLSLQTLLERLREAESSLALSDALEVPTRIVRLPLSWNDAATQLAIDKYMQSVRADAPWCPSNIEFIRRINGLSSTQDVQQILFDASYLVLGLGDVYLGAPVATPVDPRHRLVTTKYNPARTWTPENAVGIGGAYLCVYGMEGPGGYQFVGRTCQMWNTYGTTRDFSRRRPWLLRFFDQIRFYPVSGEELLEFRADFLHGRVHLDIRDDVFRLRDYRRFLLDNAADIAAAKSRQQAAFEAERRRWQDSGQIGFAAEMPAPQSEATDEVLAANETAVASPVSGNVWKLSASVGQRVRAGDTLAVIESMKMELPVTAPMDAVVSQVRCAEGRAVGVAQTLVVLRNEGQ